MSYLVVGTESPVAAALVTRLLEQGINVVGTYSVPPSDKLTRLRNESEGKLRLVELNLGDLSAVRTFASEQPEGYTAVVYAHMYFEMEPISGFDEAQWTRSVVENLAAPAALFTESSTLLADGGSAVIVTSTEAFRGSYRAGAYAASKAAVHNLVMTLANNLGPHGVRVNAVAAGWIGGVMDTDEVFEMSRRITPLGRLGTPAEVANVLAFLTSAEASFISGSVVTVDGGYTGVDTISKYESESVD
ncbi:SDR family NAD(P)-dependent oxidoreductase [Glycomyces sp. MUSA5-2]|uniref:SDR family NAD(P)-dependent oxidoreductase n=1 Tax=Glycomyces sp. MUSA5-2 TaxID=2053002 RepID=UPI00300A3C30